MAHIETLIADIYSLIDQGFTGSKEWGEALGQAMADEVSYKFSEERGASYLRPSNLGDKCDRKLWYGVNQHTEAEALPAPTKIKFLYGNILEEMVLALADAAGHDVQARQKEVSLHGVKGHIDAVVDGVLIDAKSASSIAFQKFYNHLSSSEDSFGYLTQIGFYLEALQDDPVVTDKERCAFLVIDKTLGKLCLDIHERGNLRQDWVSLVEKKRDALSLGTVPARGFLPEPDGKSGNLKLGLECSYCSFKDHCWPRLRTYLYSSGPRYLTHVAREPDVPERKS